MRRNSHRPRGKCSWKASTNQWLCRHLVETAMTLVEIDVLQNETGSEPPHEEDEDEDEDDHPRRICTTLGFKRQRMQSQGSARPPRYSHRGRRQAAKVDMETGEEVGTVLHGTRSPNMSCSKSIWATKEARAPRSQHQP